MAFTFFFRDTQTLELVAELALPELKRRQYIRVWDAGCAFGPEPYSLAIILREHMGHFQFRNVRIHATDIDESDFGSIIANGVYSETELGRLPADLLSRYFQPHAPGYFQINEEMRRAVHFQRHDLLTLEPVRDDFGLIVCKNVLLHLTPEQRVNVIKMFHHSLVPDGYFVTENTQKLPLGTEHLFRQITGAAQLFQKLPN
jgi:chemotaxis protein methyltransferase CheR